MRLNALLGVFVVLVSLVLPGTVLAQTSDLDRTSVFPDDIVRVGDPVEVTLCHIPPGNPENAQTINVEQQDAADHLAHGDLLGECPFECNGVPSPVAQTGQTECWSSLGPPWVPIDCAGTGQDGEYQYGVSVDPRFTDNGDGTVTDNLTGLIWLQNASCFGADWTNALANANTLADGACGLVDGSVAGDWRLPNVRELHSLIDYDEIFPALPSGHPFSGVVTDVYWSSTTGFDPEFAWRVDLWSGFVLSGYKTQGSRFWPVRNGL